MQDTRNDLALEVRTQACDKLQLQLSQLIDLKLRAKQAHWNVKGEFFYSLHELFDKLASEADVFADDVAERIVQLGGSAEGLAKSVTARSKLPDFPAGAQNGLKFVEILVQSYAEAGRAARAAVEDLDRIGDKDAADLMTGISRGLDKALWMLEAHLYRK